MRQRGPVPRRLERSGPEGTGRGQGQPGIAPPAAWNSSLSVENLGMVGGLSLIAYFFFFILYVYFDSLLRTFELAYCM